MSETSDQFKKRPRQKKSPGKRVTVSDEAKKAYEALVTERGERAENYERHLPWSEKIR